MKYHCSSPLLREVKVVRLADGKPGNIKKHRRAKLFYYRDVRPPFLPLCIASSVRALRSTLVVLGLTPCSPLRPARTQQPERLAAAANVIKDNRSKASSKTQVGTAFA